MKVREKRTETDETKRDKETEIYGETEINRKAKEEDQIKINAGVGPDEEAEVDERQRAQDERRDEKMNRGRKAREKVR